MPYGPDAAPNAEGDVIYASLRLAGQQSTAMDSALDHRGGFNEAVSFLAMKPRTRTRRPPPNRRADRAGSFAFLPRPAECGSRPPRTQVPRAPVGVHLAGAGRLAGRARPDRSRRRVWPVPGTGPVRHLRVGGDPVRRRRVPALCWRCPREASGSTPPATTREPAPTRTTQAIRWITIIGGVAFLAFGLWAFVAPQSFFDQLATYEPDHPHLIRDIGAFQVRLGAVLLVVALLPTPSAGALLLWAGVAAMRHPHGATGRVRRSRPHRSPGRRLPYGRAPSRRRLTPPGSAAMVADPHRPRARRHLAVAVLAAVAVAGCVEVETAGTSDPTTPATASSQPSTATAPPPPPTRADGTSDPPDADATVVDVVDGDTLDVQVDGTVERVRLIGINTPETGECFADQAREALADLTAGEQVRLELDRSERDRYGRILAYLHVDGQHVNATLVRNGYAIARSYPPDTARDDELAAAQAEAQQAGAGMWGPDGCASDVDGSTIAITVQADAPGDDNANLGGEWLEIRNTSDAPLDLSGWTVKDESASHRHTFADGTTVAPGATLRLVTGCGQDTATERHWCRTDSAVWNNSGDTAFLLDADGRTVTTHAY